MDAHISLGKQQLLQPQLDALDSYFVVPANFTPDMPEEAWQAEIEAMFALSLASRSFVEGKISPDEFSQALDQYGYDPHELWERWENGLTLTHD